MTEGFPISCVRFAVSAIYIGIGKLAQIFFKKTSKFFQNCLTKAIINVNICKLPFRQTSGTVVLRAKIDNCIAKKKKSIKERKAKNSF